MQGLAMGVNTIRSPNSNVTDVGLNSLLLVRSTVQSGLSSLAAAVDWIADQASMSWAFARYSIVVSSFLRCSNQICIVKKYAATATATTTTTNNCNNNDKSTITKTTLQQRGAPFMYPLCDGSGDCAVLEAGRWLPAGAREEPLLYVSKALRKVLREQEIGSEMKTETERGEMKRRVRVRVKVRAES
jgi:hypothetical protein